MKKITFALLIFCAIACGDRECINLNIGTQTEIKNGDLVCVDGEEFELFASDDRCECGTNCWIEGQFTFSFIDLEGVNVYNYDTADTMSNSSNTTPPFSDSFRMVSFSGGNPDCGEPNNVDEITFVVQID